MSLDFFNNVTYFTNKDFEAFTHKKNSHVLLTNLKNNNTIIQIERGKYTLHEDPLIYASHIIYPSYISGISALYYYKLTTQIPLKTLVLTKEVKRNNSHITFIKSPKTLFFGYTKKIYKKFEIFIVTKEKLLIDSIYFQKLGVSISDLDNLLQEQLDTTLIISYLKQINNISLIKRVGYLLEQHNMNIHNSFKKVLEQDSNYIKLEQNLPKKQAINSKWKLNINI
ncbi:MAG: hypothetical protein LAT82_06065 [Nanoarchaeota archaeon]|nr:hypothetical protein [Nanoarchaeota archaeon]